MEFQRTTFEAKAPDRRARPWGLCLGVCDFRAAAQRGSVLVIVMITLIFAAAALVLFIEQASTDLLVASRDATAERLRRDAYSVLESTLATLDDFRAANGALHGVAEGWGEPLKFSGWQPRDGVTAEVTLEDESGKISLSRVDVATLINLFKYWDVKQADAERLADVLLGWMRRDHVSTSGTVLTYDQGDLPFQPPQRALRSYGELASIDYAREVFYDANGAPNDLWRRFVGTFSLFNYSQLNINAAPPDVLAALGFTDLTQQNTLHDYLQGTGGYSAQGPAWFTSTAQAAGVLGTTALPQGVGTQVRALRINVMVREGQAQLRVSAVVAPPGGASIVRTTATSNRSVASGTGANTNSSTITNPTQAAATSQPATPPPAINYPFTLLEITENAEMSAPPTEAEAPKT